MAPFIVLLIYMIGAMIGIAVCGYRRSESDITFFFSILWPFTVPLIALFWLCTIPYNFGWWLSKKTRSSRYDGLFD